MSRYLPFFVSVLSFAPLSATATPIDYVLDMNSLPSAQGWANTSGSNINESVFTANGTLAWNTMPYDVNVTYQNYSYYTRTPDAGTFDTSPWTLFWDVKVTESEPATPAYYWAGAYTFVGLDGYNLGIGLGTNNISIFKDYYAWSYSFNFALPETISDWTRIKVSTTADHHFSIYLDDVLLELNQTNLLTTPAALGTHKFNGAAPVTPAWDNLLGGTGPGTYTTGSLLAIGDGSIGSNANTETGCWYLTQSAQNADATCVNRQSNTGSGGTIPEPGSLALLGLGVLGLVASRRRK